MNSFPINDFFLLILFINLWNFGVPFRSIESLSSQLAVTSSITSLKAGREMFNPFLRERKTQNRWFEPSLTQFFEFVDTQRLLTAEQELQYGKAIKMWQHVEKTKLQLQQNSSYLLHATNLTIEEEVSHYLGCSTVTLLKIQKYAQIARYRLINCNMKLVLSVVSRYRKHGLANFELISVGVRGLEKAVEKYDYARGFRFATYATWYVHQQITDYIRWQKTSTKLSGRYIVLLRKIKQLCGAYKREYLTNPSLQYLAQHMNLTESEVKRVLISQQTAMLTSTPSLLDSSSSSSGSSSHRPKMIQDFLESNVLSPEKKLTMTRSEDTRGALESLMRQQLNYVERDILRLHYGLDRQGKGMVFREIGKRYGVTWKELKQVEQQAMQKLIQAPSIDMVYGNAEVFYG
jgi:RNA polymerase primary sigma factor